jgi:hypothetical protein
MFKSEYQANAYGFTCAPMAHKQASKAKHQGVNVFKLAGYVLALVVIVAAVY